MKLHIMYTKFIKIISTLCLLISFSVTANESIRVKLNEYAFPNGKTNIDFSSGIVDEYKGYERQHLHYENKAYASTAFLFKPNISTTNEIFIVNGGHGQSALENWNIIELLLKGGRMVYAIGMPCSVEIPCLGSTYWRHEALYGYSELDSPLGAMLAQVIAALNHSNSIDVAMTGISGGGWTTVVAAALDERITRSIPVAGSLPINMRRPGALGDAEQIDKQMLSICDYLCLYALGASNGIQIQINNSDDPCCFAGSAPLEYAEEVQSKAGSSGTFKAIIDQNDKHSYGEKALLYLEKLH